MAKWGSVNFDEMQRLADSFNKALDERVIDRFIRELLTELAYRALRKVKKRTPVDSGDLRRKWTVGEIQRKGNGYVVEIYNNTEYASFVEHGHRKRGGSGWVEGRFMMTISLQEIERELPRFIQKKQEDLLRQIMHGRPGKRGGSDESQ